MSPPKNVEFADFRTVAAPGCDAIERIAAMIEFLLTSQYISESCARSTRVVGIGIRQSTEAEVGAISSLVLSLLQLLATVGMEKK